MHIAARVALAVVIVVLDFVSFLVPLGSLAIAWVLITRPRWALAFVVRLYEGIGEAPGREARGEAPRVGE